MRQLGKPMAEIRKPIFTEAEIVREYGPFPEVAAIHGVTFDGASPWFAAGDRLVSVEQDSGCLGRVLKVLADAGSAFDGKYFYQLGRGVIQKLDPATGEIVATLDSPAKEGSAGLTWAEGALWISHYRERKIIQIDANTGEVLRTLESTRFVTGVTFVDEELWHGTWEDERSEIRCISPTSGEVLETITLPPGTMVSGLESDGKGLFYCGGGPSGILRVVRSSRQAGDRRGSVASVQGSEIVT
jgi:outer membrane protein assembly factor BamB